MRTIHEAIPETHLERGFGKYDDLGVFNPDLYDRNLEQANNNGQQPCNHCGRGVNLDTCYLAIYAYSSQAFIALDIDKDTLMGFTEKVQVTHAPTGETRTEVRSGWVWVFLGSECAKNLPSRFRMLHRDFPTSKWNDTDAHHDILWGTW